MAGFWVARSVSVAAKLRLADHVADAARSAEELAAATGTHAPSLYRLMRGLAGAGFFVEEPGRRFRNSPLSDVLRTGSPGSLRAVAESVLGPSHWRAWENLEHSVRTGGIAFDHAFGMDVWAFFSRNEDEQRAFNDAMTDFTRIFNPAVVKGYDFSRAGTLVDVGGGHGALLFSVLEENPAVRGVLFDQPHVVEGARGRLGEEGLSARCQLAGGSFFESVPAGDTYMMKLIIHDWDDERAGLILRNVHKASKPGARLLVIDSVVPERGAEPSLAPLMDLNMLVMTGGRERTEAEFRDLFGRAGFDLAKVHPTESPLAIVEGVRR
jgi:SAM-dependent methyltransferase